MSYKQFLFSQRKFKKKSCRAISIPIEMYLLIWYFKMSNDYGFRFLVCIRKKGFFFKSSLLCWEYLVGFEPIYKMSLAFMFCFSLPGFSHEEMILVVALISRFHPISKTRLDFLVSKWNNSFCILSVCFQAQFHRVLKRKLTFTDKCWSDKENYSRKFFFVYKSSSLLLHSINDSDLKIKA